MLDERNYFEKFRKGGETNFISLECWTCLNSEVESSDLGDYDYFLYDGD